MAYYNDNDPYVAQWLRELIAAGSIPEGTVDERDIRQIRPDGLPATCHFFAGIGGWPYALRLAGWPDDRPVWTASLPCQPWSAAGKGGGVGDERHLWPAFYALVAECRPPVIFGEQVPAAIKLGWLDGVFDSLEALGYACGAIIAPACSVGAPHIRSRIFWVAESCGWRHLDTIERSEHQSRSREAQSARSGDDGGLAESQHAERRSVGEHRSDGRHGTDSGRAQAHGESGTRGEVRGMDDSCGERTGLQHAGQTEQGSDGTHDRILRPSSWADSTVIYCRDGKWRRIPPPESGLQPLVDVGDTSSFRVVRDSAGKARGQAPWRIGMLRAAGNAIVPQAAAEFIKAWMET